MKVEKVKEWPEVRNFVQINPPALDAKTIKAHLAASSVYYEDRMPLEVFVNRFAASTIPYISTTHCTVPVHQMSLIIE